MPASISSSSNDSLPRNPFSGELLPVELMRLLAVVLAITFSSIASAHGGAGGGEALLLLGAYVAGAVLGLIAFLICYFKSAGTTVRRLTIATGAWVLVFLTCLTPFALSIVPQLFRVAATYQTQEGTPSEQLARLTQNSLQAQRGAIARERELEAIHRQNHERQAILNPVDFKAWRRQLRDERAGMTGPEVDRFRSDPLRTKLCSPAANAQRVEQTKIAELDERRYFELGEIIDNCLDLALANTDEGRRGEVVSSFMPLIVSMAHWRAARPLLKAAEDRMKIDGAVDKQCQDAAIRARSPLCTDTEKRRAEERQEWVNDFYRKAGVCHDLRMGDDSPREFCREWKARRDQGFKSQLPELAACEAQLASVNESCRAAAGYSKFLTRPAAYGFCSTVHWLGRHEVREVRDMSARVATQFLVACGGMHDATTSRDVENEAIVNAFEIQLRDGATLVTDSADLRARYGALSKFCDAGTAAAYATTVNFKRCFANDGRYKIEQTVHRGNHQYTLAQWGNSKNSYEQWIIVPPLSPYERVFEIPIKPALVRVDIADLRERMLWAIGQRYGVEFVDGLPVLRSSGASEPALSTVVPINTLMLQMSSTDGWVRLSKRIDRDGRPTRESTISVTDVRVDRQVSTGDLEYSPPLRYRLSVASPIWLALISAIAGMLLSGVALLYVVWRRTRNGEQTDRQVVAEVGRWILLVSAAVSLILLFVSVPWIIIGWKLNSTATAIVGGALIGGLLGVGIGGTAVMGGKMSR